MHFMLSLDNKLITMRPLKYKSWKMNKIIISNISGNLGSEIFWVIKIHKSSIYLVFFIPFTTRLAAVSIIYIMIVIITSRHEINAETKKLNFIFLDNKWIIDNDKTVAKIGIQKSPWVAVPHWKQKMRWPPITTNGNVINTLRKGITIVLIIYILS